MNYRVFVKDDKWWAKKYGQRAEEVPAFSAPKKDIKGNVVLDSNSNVIYNREYIKQSRLDAFALDKDDTRIVGDMCHEDYHIKTGLGLNAKFGFNEGNAETYGLYISKKIGYAQKATEVAYPANEEVAFRFSRMIGKQAWKEMIVKTDFGVGENKFIDKYGMYEYSYYNSSQSVAEAARRLQQIAERKSMAAPMKWNKERAEMLR